jgi:hypothetical protein
MNVETDRLRTGFDRERVRRATKIVLSVGALVLVLALASLLPGLDLLVPETGVTLAALVGALATLAVVGLLWYLASAFATLTRTALDGPREVVENLASVVYWLVVLVAVLVAHAGFAPVVTELIGVEWAYNVAFLVLALGPLAVVAARLYVTLDPAADAIAESVFDGSE